MLGQIQNSRDSNGYTIFTQLLGPFVHPTKEITDAALRKEYEGILVGGLVLAIEAKNGG